MIVTGCKTYLQTELHWITACERLVLPCKYRICSGHAWMWQHLQVSLSLNNLAALHHKMGRYSTAEEHYRKALAIRESTLGPFHLQVVLHKWSQASCSPAEWGSSRLCFYLVDCHQINENQSLVSAQMNPNQSLRFWPVVDRPCSRSQLSLFFWEFSEISLNNCCGASVCWFLFYDSGLSLSPKRTQSKSCSIYTT